MNLNLTRYGSSPLGTFGELQIDGLHLFTIERPWLNNQPFVSCVPAGDYILEPHRSRRYGNTWALVNHDNQVFHKKQNGTSRYGILIHVANRSRELAGCIAPGESLGTVSDEWAVMNSGHAMGAIREALSMNEQHFLQIRWALPESVSIYQLM